MEPELSKERIKLFRKRLNYLYKKIDLSSNLLWSHENLMTSGKRLRSEFDAEDTELRWMNRETTQTGYGEISKGSMTSLFNLLQNISVLIEEATSRDKSIKLKYSPSEYNMDSSSLFLDIGSGFGKPVLHSALQVSCRSVGVEVVPARVEFCLDFLFENILDKNFFASIDSKENFCDAEDKNDATTGITNEQCHANDTMTYFNEGEVQLLETNSDMEMKLFNTINLNELANSYYESVLNESSNMFIELRVNFGLIHSNEFIEILLESKKTNVSILIDEDYEGAKLSYCNYFNSNQLDIEIHTVDDILYSTTSVVLLQLVYSDPDRLEVDIIIDKLNHVNKLNLNNICKNIDNMHLLNFLLFVNSIFLARKNILHESHDINYKHYLKGCKSYHQGKKPTSVRKANKNKQEDLYKELKEELEKREKTYLTQHKQNTLNRNGSYSIQESKLLQEVLSTLKLSPYDPKWGDLTAFIKEDATNYEYYHDDDKRHFTHIYAYNKLMSAECREKVASILNRTNFKVLAWYSNLSQTSNAGLKNFYLLCKFPMQSTSTEKFHVYVYIKTR